MSFPPQFYTTSFELPLPDGQTVTEYFYLQEHTSLSPRLQTTQNPERYGGPIFLRPHELVEVLKLARGDARFSTYTVSVLRIVPLTQNPLTKDEIDALVQAELFQKLDEYELEVLGIPKAKAVP
jgi:hypothetical protein